MFLNLPVQSKEISVSSSTFFDLLSPLPTLVDWGTKEVLEFSDFNSPDVIFCLVLLVFFSFFNLEFSEISKRNEEMRESNSPSDDEIEWNLWRIFLTAGSGCIVIGAFIALIVIAVLKIREIRRRRLTQNLLIQHYREARGGEVCRMCWERTAIVFCSDCNQSFMCGKCNNSIHNKSMDSSHSQDAILCCCCCCCSPNVLNHRVVALSRTPRTKRQPTEPDETPSSSSTAAVQPEPSSSEKSPLIVNSVSQSYTTFRSLLHGNRADGRMPGEEDEEDEE